MEIHPDQARRIYQNRFGEREKIVKDKIWKVVVRSFLQRWIAPESTVLDIGCGYGEFLNQVRCGRRIGVDLNPDAAAALDKTVEFHQGSVCDLSFLPDQSVDVVFTSNLMEHLPAKADVEKMILEARRVLKPGGHFIAMGPNLRVIPGAYWDFWDHLTPITDRSLCEALVNLGFSPLECYPRFLPYTTLSRLPKWPALTWLYLKLPLAWRFFGGQFLIRAAKD